MAVLDPELERRNSVVGWALVGLFCLLVAGTFVLALVYLQLD